MIRWGEIDFKGDSISKDSRFTIRRQYRGDGGGVREFSLWDNKTGKVLNSGVPKQQLKQEAEEILRKEEGR